MGAYNSKEEPVAKRRRLEPANSEQIIQNQQQVIENLRAEIASKNQQQLIENFQAEIASKNKRIQEFEDFSYYKQPRKEISQYQ